MNLFPGAGDALGKALFSTLVAGEQGQFLFVEFSGGSSCFLGCALYTVELFLNGPGVSPRAVAR